MSTFILFYFIFSTQFNKILNIIILKILNINAADVC